MKTQNRNSKGELHGYQELCCADGKMWYRGKLKNWLPIGYIELNTISVNSFIGEKGTIFRFHIR